MVVMSFAMEKKQQNRMFFFDVQNICEEKNLPLSTINRLLVKFTHTLSVFLHLLLQFVRSTQGLLDMLKLGSITYFTLLFSTLKFLKIKEMFQKCS